MDAGILDVLADGPQHQLASVCHRVDFDLNYNVQISFPRVGDTNHSLLALISVEITEMIDLDVTGVWDRIEEPRETAGGASPESDDFRLILSFALEF